jgi:hypothetical protein
MQLGWRVKSALTCLVGAWAAWAAWVVVEPVMSLLTQVVVAPMRERVILLVDTYQVIG